MSKKNKNKESKKKFSISIILGILLVLMTIIVLFVVCLGKKDNQDTKSSENINVSDDDTSNFAGKRYFQDDDKEYEFKELTSGFAYTDNMDYFSYALDGVDFADRFITSTDKLNQIEQDLNISLKEAKKVDFEKDFVYILWNTAITDECKVKKISHVGIMNEIDEDSEEENKEKEVFSVIYKESEESMPVDESKGEFLVSYEVIKLSREYLPEREIDFKVVIEE